MSRPIIINTKSVTFGSMPILLTYYILHLKVNIQEKILF
jgi:hypothetical protein